MHRQIATHQRQIAAMLTNDFVCDRDRATRNVLTSNESRPRSVPISYIAGVYVPEPIHLRSTEQGDDATAVKQRPKDFAHAGLSETSEARFGFAHGLRNILKDRIYGTTIDKKTDSGCMGPLGQHRDDKSEAGAHQYDVSI